MHQYVIDGGRKDTPNFSRERHHRYYFPLESPPGWTGLGLACEACANRQGGGMTHPSSTCRPRIAPENRTRLGRPLYPVLPYPVIPYPVLGTWILWAVMIVHPYTEGYIVYLSGTMGARFTPSTKDRLVRKLAPLEDGVWCFKVYTCSSKLGSQSPTICWVRLIAQVRRHLFIEIAAA